LHDFKCVAIVSRLWGGRQEEALAAEKREQAASSARYRAEEQARQQEAEHIRNGHRAELDNQITSCNITQVFQEADALLRAQHDPSKVKFNLSYNLDKSSDDHDDHIYAMFTLYWPNDHAVSENIITASVHRNGHVIFSPRCGVGCPLYRASRYNYEGVHYSRSSSNMRN